VVTLEKIVITWFVPDAILRWYLKAVILAINVIYNLLKKKAMEKLFNETSA
jgi:hypothetical protein